MGASFHTFGKDYRIDVRPDGRYVIVNPDDGQVWHDANGFGYSTIDKARSAASYLCRGGSEIKTTGATDPLLDLLVFAGKPEVEVKPSDVPVLRHDPTLWGEPEPKVCDPDVNKPSFATGSAECNVIKERIARLLWEKAEKLLLRQLHTTDKGKELVYVDELSMYVSRVKVEEFAYQKQHGGTFHGW